MNRRDFVKLGAFSVFSAPFLAQSSTNSSSDLLFANCPDFLNMYIKMDFTDGKEPRFPCVLGRGDFNEILFTLPPYLSHEKEVTSLDKNNMVLSIKSYQPTGNSVHELQTRINRNAAETLLASAVDRNILVFDSQSKNSEVSPRLYSLLKTTMRRASGGTSYSVFAKKPITDVFCRRKYVPLPGGKIGNSDGVVWHGLEDKIWNYIEFFCKTLQGNMPYVYPDGKSNLLLALTRENDLGDFVHPIMSNISRTLLGKYQQDCGLAVLNNQRVILGAF